MGPGPGSRLACLRAWDLGWTLHPHQCLGGWVLPCTPAPLTPWDLGPLGHRRGQSWPLWFPEHSGKQGLGRRGDLGWPGQGPRLAAAHTQTPASRPAPQGSGRPQAQARLLGRVYPEPGGEKGQCGGDHQRARPFPQREGSPPWRSPAPGGAAGGAGGRGQGPTCAVLIKEARLLRHQRAEETVPEANVQSGKYEGKNAAPNTCGKRANCR